VDSRSNLEVNGLDMNEIILRTIIDKQDGEELDALSDNSSLSWSIIGS